MSGARTEKRFPKTNIRIYSNSYTKYSNTIFSICYHPLIALDGLSLTEFHGYSSEECKARSGCTYVHTDLDQHSSQINVWSRTFLRVNRI